MVGFDRESGGLFSQHSGFPYMDSSNTPCLGFFFFLVLITRSDQVSYIHSEIISFLKLKAKDD